MARPLKPPGEYFYLTSRIAARTAKMAGGANVGMVGSAMATIGLSMLQRKGRRGIGAVLLGGAAGFVLSPQERRSAEPQHYLRITLTPLTC